MTAAEAWAQFGQTCDRAADAHMRFAHSMGAHDGEGWVRGCPECDERLRAEIRSQVLAEVVAAIEARGVNEIHGDYPDTATGLDEAVVVIQALGASVDV